MYYKIAIGSDHAGFQLKEVLKKYLQSQKEHKIELNDWGCYSEDRADYPDFAHRVSKEVSEERSTIGILICGSANGISMSANKWQNIRCAICWMPEIAEMARLHNDANIISLPARYISEEDAIECLRVFLDTSFEGGRHKDRVEKIPRVI
jgi:ribose 5-phosphate isomerase B